MVINFMSSKNSNEIGTIHSKSINTEILIDNKTHETIQEFF